jgi:hypothetical protein
MKKTHTELNEEITINPRFKNERSRKKNFLGFCFLIKKIEILMEKIRKKREKSKLKSKLLGNKNIPSHFLIYLFGPFHTRLFS